MACWLSQASSVVNRNEPLSYRPTRKPKASLSSNSSRYPFTLRKCCHCRHGDAFVAIDKWMILGQAFPKRSAFLNEVGVITALRSCQGGFKGASVSDTKGTAESGDQLSVDGDHLIHGWVEGHWARRRRS